MASKVDTVPLRDVLLLLRSPEGAKLLEPLVRDTHTLAFQRNNDPVDYYGDDGTPSLLKHSKFEVDVLEGCLDKEGALGITRGMPGAVIEAFSQVADAEGRVHLDQVGKTLGAYAAGLAQRLADKLQGFQHPELPINTKYENVSDTATRKIVRSFKSDWGRSRMPLLGMVSRMLGGPDAFQGFQMASLSHLFATRPALYTELEKNGLERGNHLISGKGYSRNIDVVYQLQADGWWVDPTLTDVDNNYKKGDKNDDARARSVLAKLFAGVDPSSDKKFLLLDDGGNLLIALHEHYPQFAHMCRVVEQTDHGIQRLEQEILGKGKKLLCPVINMARSELKKLFEAPMIGEAILHSTETLLADIHPSLSIKGKEVALLGFGAVNQATADALLRRKVDPSKIWVFDTDPEKMKLAKERGFQVGTRKDALLHAQLLFSATGQTTITPDEYGVLPADAILINGGSGNHELGMDQLETKAKAVASLTDGSRFTKLGARWDQQAPEQIVEFMNVALGRLSFLESVDKQPLPKTASILGYDQDAKKAIQMMLAEGYKKSDILVSESDPARRAEALVSGFKLVDRETAIQHGMIVVTDRQNALYQPAELSKLKKYAVQVFHGELPVDYGTDTRRLAASGHTTPEQRDSALARGEESYRGHLVNNAANRTGEAYRHRVLRTGVGNDVLVLRSGYVVNMETGIPPEYAQLILSMLLTGLLQATKETEPKLVTLEHQGFLRTQMEKLLHKIGRKLKVPTFSGLAPVG